MLNIKSKIFNNFLHSGYLFSENEFRLKTKYMLSNAILLILSFVLTLLAILHLFLENYRLSQMNFIAVFIALNTILLLRYIPKRLFYVFAHIVFMCYLSLILLTFYLNVDIFPVTKWFLIYLMAILFIFNPRIVFVYAIIFFIIYVFLVVSNDAYNNAQYIGAFIAPSILGYVFIYFYELRANDALSKLTAINHTLEERIEHETKERTEILEHEKLQLSYLAHHDYLTKLPNIAMLDNFLETLFSHKHKKFALLYLDLNGFKKINDNFGHKVGNYVIKTIAKRLAEHTSLDHLVSRIGGDEFLIVIPNYGSIAALNKMAEKYIKTVEEEIELKMINTSLSCSIGISLYPQHSKNKSDLIVYADRAMMKAKKNKEYKYCFYEREINDLGYEIASLESDMYHALKNDEFVLYFQPQVDARNKQIVGIEALIRWQHPTLGLIDPKYFLEMAKNVGLILTLEHHIIKQSMQKVSQWHASDKYSNRVSINLSIQKLEDKNFIQEVKTLLEECQCKGEWIEFEIIQGELL